MSRESGNGVFNREPEDVPTSVTIIQMKSSGGESRGKTQSSWFSPFLRSCGKSEMRSDFSKALHGRLVGRFKPPLAGRCNDFAPSRQKKCHRHEQPSRPGPRKKKKNTAPSRPVEKKKKATPSRLGKKQQPPRPASEKKKNRPVPPRKKNKPAPSRHEQQNTKYTAPRVETGNKYHRLSLFLSFLLHIYIVL